MIEKLKRLQYGARMRLYSAVDKIQVIEVDGRRTQLLRGGTGAHLIYLHSAIGETMWLPFHQGLSREFDVIAPAHPGFAMSENGEIEDIEDVVFHYLDLFDALGLDKFYLVGASLGGWIAAEIALRHPQRIEGLVLVNSAGLHLDEGPPMEMSTLDADAAFLRSLLISDHESFVGELLFPAAHGDQGLDAISRLSFESTWNRRLYSPKLRTRLRRIIAPTLILWGDDDRLYPPRYAEAFKEEIPKSVLHFIERCGHLPMFEQESRFVAAITKFLKSCDPGFGSAPA